MNVKKLFDLTGRTVILTGAVGLLGSKYAEALSQARANVVLADKNYSACKKLAKKIREKYDVKPLPIKVNVTNKKSVLKMVSKTIEEYSKVDVLINNAMYVEGPKERSILFEDFPLSYWYKIIDVNLTGMFLCCQEVGKVMREQRRGVVINISSNYGLVGADQRIYGKSKLNSTLVYGVTKSAVLNFTRYLASYWHKFGIRVNTLSLGGVENNQDSHFIKNYSAKTMLGRMAKKDEYVGAMLFLVSDASSYMTGSNLIVDGGWTAW